MTIEDRVRTTMETRVESIPELPGLYAAVTARARVVRRRRRISATVATCVAVVAIAVPVAVYGGGGQSPAPSGPSQLPSVAPAPAVPISAPPPTASSPSLQAPTPAASSRLVVHDTPTAPPVPSLGFAAGPVLPVPLLIVDGTALSVQDHGVTYALGAYGTQFLPSLQTAHGVLVDTKDGWASVTAAHQLAILPGTKGYQCGLPYRPAAGGDYLVVTRQAGPGKPEDGADTLTGDWALYDFATHRLVDQVHAPKQGCAAATLADGRLLMTTGDGAVSGAELWTPATGLITPVPSGTVTIVGPHHTTTSVRVLGADGDGCGLYRPGTSGTHGYLGDCGSIGRAVPDARLVTLLHQHGLTVEDSVPLDSDHAVVLVSRAKTVDSASDTFTYRWLLTCATPATSVLSCVQNQQLAPVLQERFGADADQFFGPLPFLVH